MRLALFGAVVVALGAAADAWPRSLSQFRGINEAKSLFGPSGMLVSNNDEDSCPPCFNCAVPGFECTHFGDCNEFSGQCSCPPGFVGSNCSEPACGSLPRGSRRPARPPADLNGTTPQCECDEGWTGVNCNMCQTDASCAPMMPNGEGGLCYTGGELVAENWHMCNVTNRKILDVLAGRVAEVSFGCSRNSSTCDLQLWVDREESFFCKFRECEFDGLDYQCDVIDCQCVPDRLLCGADGSIDISEWLVRSVHGPGSLTCASDGSCTFEEPEMNKLIQFVFGDHSIQLDCSMSECLHYSQVPGYEPPTNPGSSLLGIISSLVIVFLSLGALTLGVHRVFLSMSEGVKPVSLPLDSGIAHAEPVTLAFDGIGYETPGGRTILRGVSGVIPAGHVLAIMGGSGAGKTTLLDILAAKNKRGTVHGTVILNGSPFSPKTAAKLRQLVGFVDQSDDGLIPTLTVFEHVVFSALLRLPRSMSRAAKELRALDTLQELKILHLRDQLVGAGLSGGERRRVAIACELVTSPSVLLLDEPTSGLDAYNAYSVVDTLVGLAKNGKRTVIFTIHQPRSNIVSLFDRILLLAQGNLLFTGTPTEALEMFTQLGHQCPQGYNLADFLIDVSMRAVVADEASAAAHLPSDATAATSFTPSSPENITANTSGNTAADAVDEEAAEVLSNDSENLNSGNEICADPEIHTMPLGDDPAREWQDFAFHRQQISRSAARALANSTLSLDRQGLEPLISAYAHSPQAAKVQFEIREELAAPRVDVEPLRAASALSQFALLAVRTFRNLYRDPMLVLTHYGISIGLGFMCGYLYFHVENDISGFQNRLGLFFFLLALFGFSTLTSLSLFARERLVFMRERANGYYHPAAYYAAKVLLDIVPLRIGPPLVFGAIVYPLVGLATTNGEPVRFLAVLVLFNLAAATIMLLIGILIADYGVSVLIGCMVNLFGILFAGLFLNQTSMPAGTAWLRNLSIFHFAYEALSVNEVRYLDLTEYKFGLKIQVPGATILSAFGFDNGAVPRDIAGLGFMATLCVIIGYVALHNVLVERR